MKMGPCAGDGWPTGARPGEISSNVVLPAFSLVLIYHHPALSPSFSPGPDAYHKGPNNVKMDCKQHQLASDGLFVFIEDSPLREGDLHMRIDQFSRFLPVATWMNNS